MPASKAAAPPLDRVLSYRLHQVDKLADRATGDAYARQFGLQPGEARCLAAIVNFGPVSVNQLAARANLDKAQASRVAQALVERGLVAKEAHPDDARGVVLQATAAGRRLGARVMRLIARRNDELFACLTRAERQQLARLLGRVLAHAQD